MTTRDKLAATVAGQMASVALSPEWIAQRAYDIADALIKASGSQPEPKPRRKRNPNALEGHLTHQWQDLSTLRKAAGLSYPQAAYQIKRIDVDVKVQGNKKLYRLPPEQHDPNGVRITTVTPEQRNPNGVRITPGKPEQHDARIDFAKSLGYATVAAALDAMGSWEFEKKFANK